MVLIVSFILAGLLVGAYFLGDDGIFIGMAIGFLLGKLVQLNNKVNHLERDIGHIQRSMQLPPIKADQLFNTKLSTGIQTAPEESLGSSTSTTLLNPDPSSVQHQLIRYRFVRNSWQVIRQGIRKFITQGNPIVRIGMLVLLFGLSFLVKHASNQGLVSLEIRLMAVVAIALMLILSGWRTRTREGGYGLVLQGGGIAALYLTVFVAAKVTALMPPMTALVLLLVIVTTGVVLAVLQNAQVLAVMATCGGFLAPILTEGGNYIGLFSFYLVLNLGVVAIAWFKAWRVLNWIGFIFTFAISSAWGILIYEPRFYPSIQLFLLSFFALYLSVSILFSFRQPPNLKGLVDGSLVFGLPLIGFGLQAALVSHSPYGSAISAVCMATIYISLAWVLWLNWRTTHRLMIESFVALGVVFATLAVPLALQAQWTTAIWALEALGLMWVGLRQHRLLSRCASYLLYLGASGALLREGAEAGVVPLVTGDLISALLLAGSALGISFALHTFKYAMRGYEKVAAPLSLWIGWCWWLAGGLLELNAHLPGREYLSACFLFFALSTLVVLRLSKRLKWPELNGLGFWLLPLTAAVSALNFMEAIFSSDDFHPLQSAGFGALLLVLGVQYYFLLLQQRLPFAPFKGLSAYHVATVWFTLSILFWEISWLQTQNLWQGVKVALLWFFSIVLPLGLIMLLSKKSRWPFLDYQISYKTIIPAPLLWLALVWFFRASGNSGERQWYLPLLNPLDLAQCAILLLVGYAIQNNLAGTKYWSHKVGLGVLAVLSFYWINVVLVRALHHYAGIDYNLTSLWHSVTVQMALSITWAACALIVMMLSTRMHQPRLWLIGALLLGIVLMKLFTKDLTGIGTFARIVSFMVVGALMLLIGYLSPMPTKRSFVNQREPTPLEPNSNGKVG